jgi:hypothetical protein
MSKNRGGKEVQRGVPVFQKSEEIVMVVVSAKT